MTLCAGDGSLYHCAFHGATVATRGVGGYCDVTLCAGDGSLYHCAFHGATVATRGVGGYCDATLCAGDGSLYHCAFHGATVATRGIGGYCDVTLCAGDGSLYHYAFHGATVAPSMIPVWELDGWVAIIRCLSCGVPMCIDMPSMKYVIISVWMYRDMMPICTNACL